MLTCNFIHNSIWMDYSLHAGHLRLESKSKETRLYKSTSTLGSAFQKPSGRLVLPGGVPRLKAAPSAHVLRVSLLPAQKRDWSPPSPLCGSVRD